MRLNGIVSSIGNEIEVWVDWLFSNGEKEIALDTMVHHITPIIDGAYQSRKELEIATDFICLEV